MTWFSLTLILFLIMDPLGSLGAYLGLVKELPKPRQQWVILREMLIALAIMVLFNFIGEWLFSILQISDMTVRISSGLILLLVALKILFAAGDSPRANLPKGEPFIIPLAVPLIAGPSLIATIMLFAHMEPSVPVMLSAILAAWLAGMGVFLAAPFLQRALGSSGLVAIERLMGMVLALLAIQRLFEGIHQFIRTCQ